MMKKRIVLMGPQGCGKGTQAAILKDKLGIAHISTGDMLREKIAAGSPNGLKAKAFVDKGELVPSDIVLGIIEERLAEPDCKNGCLFDGYPRSADQAAALSKISPVDKVIYLKLDEEVLLNRLRNRRVCGNRTCGEIFSVTTMKGDTCPKCGDAVVQRKDDKDEEAVKKRLSEFKDKTAPLIDYYANLGLLATINADQKPEKVTEDILAALK